MTMMKWLGGAMLLTASLALGHGHVPAVDDSNPDAARIRLCTRMSEVALQAMNDRDKGKPMKLYEEDGSDAPKLANGIIHHVYGEPQIASTRAALAVGRGRCNEHFERQR